MKRIPLMVAVAMLASAPVVADLHFREKTRDETLFLFFTTDSEPGPIQELWIGERRAHLTQSDRSYILDLDRERFFFVNHRTGTYVDAFLPLNLTEMMSAELLSSRARAWVSGQVRETRGTREILGFRCDTYTVTMWNATAAGRGPERTFTVWATTEIAVDEELLGQLVEFLRLLHNRDPELRRELGKIRGVQMAIEHEEKTGFAWKRRHVSEVIAVDEDEPPAGTYAPPPNYKKKPRLTPEDF